MSSFLHIHDLCAKYTQQDVLTHFYLEIQKRERWAFLGKNGAGKSTLIRMLAGFHKPWQGSIEFQGKNLSHFSSKERARAIAYMPQTISVNIPLIVKDFVMMGRNAHQGLWALPSQQDVLEVNKAMESCDILHLQNRLMTELSGGELQRVLLAGAVAQSAELLLLDEPTTFLDPAHQRQFYDSISRLQEEKDLTLIMVTHDLNSALELCTHIGALDQGNLVFAGTKENFVTKCPQILNDIYTVEFNSYRSNSADFIAYGTWKETRVS